jgi:hypothetical protein
MLGDEMEGICLACGERQGPVEPDAMNYPCESCGERKVWGIEQAVLAGRVTVDEEEPQ